jgi:AMP-binding enzyme
MILGEARTSIGVLATLDDLFRRAGVRDPDALALVDPPNRESFTDGPARSLTFGAADRAISSLAARLHQLRLPTDCLVATQLPNTVESIIAFLGILRAGMIAVPLPLLWRRGEMAAALASVSAKAILTTSRVGAVAHAALAMEAAAEVFAIRHVCSFGDPLPDGTVGLDDIFDADGSEFPQTSVRPGSAAAHLAAVTFGVDAKGLVPMARSHAELTAGGLAPFLECGAPPRENFLSTIPISSFPGIAVSLMPWLLSGGSLHLHHGFDPDTFGAQLRTLQAGVVILPAPAMMALEQSNFLNATNHTLISLWRAPERLAAATPSAGAASVVDVVAFGDIGIVAGRRGENGMPTPIPYGVASAPRGAIGAMTVIETARNGAGTLTLRGPMVPTNAFPPALNEEPAQRLASDKGGYRDTGYACRLDRRTQSLAITAPPAGLVTVGGYSFGQNAIEACIAKADMAATIVALPVADLGQRLAGTTADRNRLYAELETAGVNPLVSAAFRPRRAAGAA